MNLWQVGNFRTYYEYTPTLDFCITGVASALL